MSSNPRILCHICGITAIDNHGDKWIEIHRKHGTNACEASVGAHYMAKFFAEKQAAKDAARQAKQINIPDNALCQICGITEDDTEGYKWYDRHRTAGEPACKWALAARRARELPRRQGRTVLAQRRLQAREQGAGWSDMDHAGARGWLIPRDALCNVCGIAPSDTTGRKWEYRHYARGIPACEPSLEARRAWNNKRNAERRKKQLHGPGSDKRPWWTMIDPDALCQLCGITEDEALNGVSSKWQARHRSRGTVACRWSMDAFNRAKTPNAKYRRPQVRLDFG